MKDCKRRTVLLLCVAVVGVFSCIFNLVWSSQFNYVFKEGVVVRFGVNQDVFSTDILEPDVSNVVGVYLGDGLILPVNDVDVQTGDRVVVLYNMNVTDNNYFYGHGGLGLWYKEYEQFEYIGLTKIGSVRVDDFVDIVYNDFMVMRWFDGFSII